MRTRSDNKVSFPRACVITGVVLTLWLCAGCAAMHSTSVLTFLAVTPNRTAIAMGDTLQFKVVATYSNGATEDVTGSVVWETLDPGVATVTASGLASSIAVGKTTIVASKSGAKGEAALAVSTAALTGIAITAPAFPIALGQSAQLRATGTYTDKSTQDITNSVNWSAAQPEVIAFSAAGLAVSQAVGSTQIIASQGNISASSQLTVSPTTLASIGVSASQSSLPLGGVEQLTATGTYTDGSTKDFTASATWTSSAPGILAVSNAGAVAAQSVGVAMVSAAVSGISGSANLTVSFPALVSIAVSAGRASLPLGGTEQLTATGTYTDGSTQDFTASATWTSSAQGVLAVSSGGAVTTKSAGAAVVSAAVASVTGSAILTVSSAVLASIAVSASQPSLPLGGTEQVTATGTYTDGSTNDVTAIATWTSSAPSVLAVSSAGAITTKSVGTATVSAAISGILGTTHLTVSSAALMSIAVNASLPSLPLGNTVQLNAMGRFTDGSAQDLTGSVNWSSSSPAVLTITPSGLATGISMGTASVAASSSSVSGMVSLSVSAPVLSTLTLAPAGPTVPLGSTLQLTVTGTYSDNSTQDVTQQVTWNVDVPAVAGINAAGLASGLQVGTTGIEASLNGVQTSDTLTVQPLFIVGYFDATSGTDSTIRITNPATTGQNLCAMVYVFDQDQQMSECCGCLVSQDGLLTLSLNKDLRSNPLTGVASKSGTVMLVAADRASNASCDASAITPAGTVIAWSTHLAQSSQVSSAEEAFSNSPLSATLSSALQAQCSFVQQLGSGQGQCSCGNSH